MKKLLTTIGIILLAVAGFGGYHYYATTYATHTEYAQLPNKIPKKTQTKDAHGQAVPDNYRYIYKLTFYDEQGQAHQRRCEVRGDQHLSPLPANAYIKMTTSETRSQTPVVISQKQVPQKVLAKLT